MRKIKTIVIFQLIFATTIVSSGEQNWHSFKNNILTYITKMDGWCPIEKADRMMELTAATSPDIFVEIGVFGGMSFLPVAATMKYKKRGIAFGIDPWEVSPCLLGNEEVHKKWWSKVNFPQIYSKFITHMHENNLVNYFKILKMTSEKALSLFEDNSIDIIHIDGNHSEESALFDATNWLPKVKVGGYIWFDDVNWQTTERAVSYLYQYCTLDPSSKPNDHYVLFKKTNTN